MKNNIILKLLLSVLILLNVACKSLAEPFKEEVVELYQRDKELDKKFFELLTFELSDSQSILGGANSKCILKGSDGRLWFFKATNISIPLDSVSRTFKIFGVNNIPQGYYIKLPINGRHIGGQLQEFISNTEPLSTIPIQELSKKEIEFIQKQQIIDWFMMNEEAFECCSEKFLRKNNKLFNIDKGDGLVSIHCIKEELIENLDNLKKSNYYNSFWIAYISRYFDVDFNKSFELIDFIQSLDDDFIKILFEPIIQDNELFLSLLIERKKKLRTEFENYYRYLTKKRGDGFRAPLALKNSHFSKQLLKHLNKDLEKKQNLLKLLRYRIQKPQCDIQVIISMPETRALLEKVSRPEFYYQNSSIEKRNNFIIKLKELSKSMGNFNERLDLYLHMYRLKHIGDEITEDNFFDMEHWAAYSPDKIDIQRIESILRVVDYNSQEPLSKINENNKNFDNIFHILISTCILDDPSRKINIYKKLHNNNLKFSEELSGLLDVFNFSISDDNYIPQIIDRLKMIKNNLVWKHFFLAVSYYRLAFWQNNQNYKKISILELKKVVKLTEDKNLLYVTYIFLGYLYEHNSAGFRFGKGFEIGRAIKAYRMAAKFRPDSLIPQLNLSALYLIDGRPNKVYYHFNLIKKVSPGYADEHFHFKEDFYAFLKTFSKAEQLKVLKIHSLNGEQCYILGLAHYIQGQKDMACRYFNKAKELGYSINEIF